MDRALARRVVVGKDVRVTSERGNELHLEGGARLCPGQIVELVFPIAANDATTRTALVISWAVAELGKNGVVYRGVCGSR